DRHLKLFFDLGKAGLDALVAEDEEETVVDESIPDMKIEELDFSQRTFNCLRRAGILDLRALAKVTEADLVAIRGFGKKSLSEVREKLEEHDLELKPAKSYLGPDS